MGFFDDKVGSYFEDCNFFLLDSVKLGSYVSRVCVWRSFLKVVVFYGW